MKRTLVAVAFATLVASPGSCLSPQAGDRCDPYFGTYAGTGCTQYCSGSCPDPYAGTVWNDVYPYGAPEAPHSSLSHTIARRVYAAAATLGFTRVRFVRGCCIPTPKDGAGPR